MGRGILLQGLVTGDLSEFVRIRKDFVMNRVWDIINDTIAHIRELRVFRSFRMRIFLLMLIIGIVPIIIVQSAILNNYETRAVSVRKDEVSNQLMVIATHLLIYNYLTTYKPRSVAFSETHALQ